MSLWSWSFVRIHCNLITWFLLTATHYGASSGNQNHFCSNSCNALNEWCWHLCSPSTAFALDWTLCSCNSLLDLQDPILVNDLYGTRDVKFLEGMTCPQGCFKAIFNTLQYLLHVHVSLKLYAIAEFRISTFAKQVLEQQNSSTRDHTSPKMLRCNYGTNMRLRWQGGWECLRNSNARACISRGLCFIA